MAQQCGISYLLLFGPISSYQTAAGHIRVVKK
jgi:hypothetical protein